MSTQGKKRHPEVEIVNVNEYEGITGVNEPQNITFRRDQREKPQESSPVGLNVLIAAGTSLAVFAFLIPKLSARIQKSVTLRTQKAINETLNRVHSSNMIPFSGTLVDLGAGTFNVDLGMAYFTSPIFPSSGVLQPAIFAVTSAKSLLRTLIAHALIVPTTALTVTATLTITIQVFVNGMGTVALTLTSSPNQVFPSTGTELKTTARNVRVQIPRDANVEVHAIINVLNASDSLNVQIGGSMNLLTRVEVEACEKVRRCPVRGPSLNLFACDYFAEEVDLVDVQSDE